MLVEVVEILETIQGEGIFAGLPSVLLRFQGCNLNCIYCDTPEAKDPKPYALIGSSDKLQKIANPIPVDRLIDLIVKEYRSAKTVLITGGEPLVQKEAAIEAGRRLKHHGFWVHLETNATIEIDRKSLLEAFDFISMDVKLPWSQAGKDVWAEHRRFIEEIEGHPASIKIVISPDSIDEARNALFLISDINRNIPVLLQPVHIDGKPSVDAKLLLDLCRFAQGILTDVRVSIQIHKVLGLR